MLPGKKGIFLPGVNAHPGNLLIGVRSGIIRKKPYQLSILLIPDDTERKNNPAGSEEYNFPVDKETNGKDNKDLSFWSLITPRKGNIATPLLICINVALFIVMSICGVSLIEPTGHFFDEMGCRFWPAHTYR